MSKTQIFISYKYHDGMGNILPDFYMAKDLYEKLSTLGLDVFFSDETIRNVAQSDYKQLIDDKLDEAEILIVVSTAPEHCKANWVRYEWDSFYNDILSEKKKGQLISYLDTTDIRNFPRTIRTLQVFEKKNNGINSLIDFIKSYFNIIVESSHEETIPKGSSYNYDSVYELGDERKRLAIQGKVESKNDYDYLCEIFKTGDRVYSVLDVGCSVGSVTKDVFSKFGQSVKILGVDKFEQCVEEFNKNTPDNMSAELLDFENPDWEKRLAELMNIHNIESFDLVYCSLSLHHMSDSKSVIKNLWKYISNKGYIYIRTCDDALKIAYPNEDVIYEIIRKTAGVPQVSDRFHGRKIYSMLYKSKYNNITIKSFLIDTVDKELEERYALFYSAFVWRRNYFKRQLELAQTQEQIESAMDEYNNVIALLDKIEELFSDESFYFGYYVTIAMAQKNNFLENYV